jgi:6-phosphogluconolactonase (cycloisomerase 2 family)
MPHRYIVPFTVFALAAAVAPPAGAQILAMVNYESKVQHGLKGGDVAGHPSRKEGIAVIDVDPASKNFGKILANVPLPASLVAHHIFYNRDMSKAYVTALGLSRMYVMDMKKLDYKLKKIKVDGCKVGEDVVFSDDNKTWYLTCMGSANIVVGDAVTDKVKSIIKLPKPYPHGIAIHEGIDRILVTETVSPDLKVPGETVTAIEISTGKPLKSYKLSEKPSPSGEAPVEILFVPGANPPVAYVTNMFGHTLWTATWNPAAKDFEVAKAFDFNGTGSGVPLEMYFNAKADRLYVTTANPGHLHVFDLKDGPGKPKLTKTLPAAGGAHHVAFTKDWRYAFVQNALLNLKGMDDGSITIVDLKTETVVGKVDTLKNLGLNPNSIVLLPKWNHLAGH